MKEKPKNKPKYQRFIIAVLKDLEKPAVGILFLVLIATTILSVLSVFAELLFILDLNSVESINMFHEYMWQSETVNIKETIIFDSLIQLFILKFLYFNLRFCIAIWCLFAIVCVILYLEDKYEEVSLNE